MHSPQDAGSVEGRRAPASRGDIQRCVDTALSEFTRTTRPSVTSTLATAMLGLRAVCHVTPCIHGVSVLPTYSIGMVQSCISPAVPMSPAAAAHGYTRTVALHLAPCQSKANFRI